MTLVCEDAVINKTLGFHDNFLFNSLGRLSGSNKLSDVPWSLMASKLSPNWKPLGLVISTSWPTNHWKGTKIEYWYSNVQNGVCADCWFCLFVYPHWLQMMSFWRFSRLHLLHHLLALPNLLVLLLSSNSFSRRLDPTIPHKHSETGMTLFIWPWPMKIAGEDLSLVPQTLMNLPCIPLGTLWISEDFTDVPLACGDIQLKKRTK